MSYFITDNIKIYSDDSDDSDEKTKKKLNIEIYF